MRISGIKAIVFDLDGTIYVGRELISGADSVVAWARERGLQVIFVTNASGITRRQVAEKIGSLGIPATEGNVITSAYATAIYVRDHGLGPAACFGTDALRCEMRDAGVEIRDDSLARSVVIGHTIDFNFNTITQALSLLLDGTRVFVACNIDANYPGERGVLHPGCGALVAAIATAVERRVDVVVGKPDTFMIDLICRRWGYQPCQVLIVGDRIESDVAMAKASGSPTVLVSKSAKIAYDGIILIDDIRKIPSEIL